MKKLLFFDIDGTLVDFGNSTMSPSTADALINAKQNGHMIFLCTGRSYNQIYPSLKAFDFDGVVACCPFHNDKTPSMKLDKRFHCFGCGADGDVIDFVAALYGLGKKEAAAQLASDFGLAYEDWKPPGRARKPKPRQKSPEEQFREAKAHCFRVLADYLHLLRVWKTDYAPHSPEEAFHPRFVEALQKQAHVEYLLDVLLFGDTEEIASLITEHGKDVIQLEQRMAELAAADAARTKKHHERHAAAPER